MGEVSSSCTRMTSLGGNVLPRRSQLSRRRVTVLLRVNTTKENVFVPAFEVGTSLADSALYCVNVTDYVSLERSKHRSEFVTLLVFT